MKLEPGNDNFFEELARNFFKKGRRMVLWLKEEEMEYRRLNESVIAKLAGVAEKVTKKALEVKNGNALAVFEVNDTTVVSRTHFTYGLADFAVLELEFEDSDNSGFFWIGIIQGKANIMEFVEKIQIMMGIILV